ncbi:MAG: MATE family efflux transporter, partial [Oscillospiraceae bacterium]|nr:MATE family efflux transporter [Oscillospiraceae bacterium]
EKLGQSVGNAVTLIAVITVALTAAALPFTRSILTLTHTPSETFELANTYLVIVMFGFVGTGFYNVLSGILRGLGDTVFPLLTLVCSSVLNIVLDIWFVSGGGLNMGIGGAALATIISQYVSALICGVRIFSMRKRLSLNTSVLRLRGSIVKNMLRLGIPSGISTCVLFLGIILLQSLVNSMGYMVTACITACIKIDSFAVLPSQTFSAAGSTFTGQNIGAGKMDRVKQGSRTLMALCFSLTVVMVAIMIILARWLIGLFTTTEEIITLGFSILIIMVPSYLFMCINQCLCGVMTGAGDSMAAMWISIISHVFLRTPLAYVFAYFSRSAAYPHGHPYGVFWSMDIAMLIGAAITVIHYYRGTWRNKSLVKSPEMS